MAAAKKARKKRTLAKAKSGKKKSAASRAVARKKVPRAPAGKSKRKPGAKSPVKQTVLKGATQRKRTASRRSHEKSWMPPDAGLLPSERGDHEVESGDLQGLSSAEGADSESVEELLEDGDAFEAEAVSGVEAADDGDEKEVRTREVPEDDVPSEYLDEE